MTVFEIILLVCGLICVVVSFIMGDGNETSVEEVRIDADLTDEQKESIRKQINELLQEEIAEISEKTEASLDKISNTKILEMNEYADTIMNEINKNHNETVFLYDMLNEKAKEVKSTVKNVNIAKKQVEQIKAQADVEKEPAGSVNTDSVETSYSETRDLAKERLVELVRKSNEKVKNTVSNDKKGTQAEKLDDIVKNSVSAEKNQKSLQTAGFKNKSDKEISNENILKLYEAGYDNRQIAKELNIGVGEVNLVIDLYNSEK